MRPFFFARSAGNLSGGKVSSPYFGIHTPACIGSDRIHKPAVV
jgi:hypothetical protein